MVTQLGHLNDMVVQGFSYIRGKSNVVTVLGQRQCPFHFSHLFYN